MAKNQTMAVRAVVLKADANALAAMANIGKYAPANPDYALDKLQAVYAALQAASDAFAQAEADWMTRRDAHVAAQWAFHNAMLSARQNVVAQFGDNSDEAQAVGLIKTSEYKNRRRKTTTTAPAPAAAQ